MIILTEQIVGVEVVPVAAVIRILMMILFLDMFLVFASRICGLLQTFIGLITAEFATLISIFNRLFGGVIKCVDKYGNGYFNGYLFPAVFTVPHVNGLLYFVTVCGLLTTSIF